MSDKDKKEQDEFAENPKSGVAGPEYEISINTARPKSGEVASKKEPPKIKR